MAKGEVGTELGCGIGRCLGALIGRGVSMGRGVVSGKATCRNVQGEIGVSWAGTTGQDKTIWREG